MGGDNVAPSMDIGLQVRAVPLARSAVIGMGRWSDTKLVHAAPVTTVVAGLTTGQGEVGYFVMMEACCLCFFLK